MSAQPLVFEGPDPERLLLDVWSKLGTDVRISAPQQVRKGGVLGFFAKINYRIEVEAQGTMTPPAGSGAAPRSAGAAAPSAAAGNGLDVTGIDAAAVGAYDGRLARPASGRPPSWRPPERAPLRAVSRPGPADEENDLAAAAAGAENPTEALDRMVEATEDVFEREELPKRSFDEVLHGVASSLGDEPPPFSPPPFSPPPFNPPPFNIAAALGAGTLTDPEPEAGQAPAPAPEIEAEVETEQAPEPAAIPRGRISRAGEPLVAPAAAEPATAPAATEAAVAVDDVAITQRDEVGTTLRELGQIGIPESLLASAATPAPGQSIAEAAFAAAPAARPLPDVPGALIAILGELGAAFDLAGTIADELDVEDAEIAVATPTAPTFDLPQHLLVHDAKRAAALAPGWRRDTIAVVVVDTDAPGATTTWIRSMLRGLRPTATWTLANARQKTEDVAHFVAEIGGVDAIVLADLHGTVSPASVLGAGIPVARIDGEPATPENWAEAVARHLTLKPRASGA